MIQVIISSILSAGFFQLIQFFVTRHDAKKGNMAGIKADISELKKRDLKIERDSCRTQMMLLMTLFPEDSVEIMTVARHYFEDLQGDWYATSLFQAWMRKNNIIPPPWFNSKNHSGA